MSKLSIRAATQDPVPCGGKFWSELAGGKWVKLGEAWTDRQWSDIEYYARDHLRLRRRAAEARAAGNSYEANDHQYSANNMAAVIREKARTVIKYGSTLNKFEQAAALVFL